jgi:preprotein translocase subunit SecG
MLILFIFLTILMFIDCVLLVLLVLLQLPKKDAGAGVAFGGAATDALFGAGSGNVLTRITKWVAGIYFGLALLIAVLSSHRPKSGGALLLQDLTSKGTTPISQPATQTSVPVTTPNNGGLLQIPPSSSSSPATPAAAPSKSTAPAAGTNK